MEFKFKPVEVEWTDANSSLDSFTISELEAQEIPISRSCGYLIKEDKEKIVLAFMTFGHNVLGELIMKHYQVIPKGMIKKIRTLKAQKK